MGQDICLSPVWDRQTPNLCLNHTDKKDAIFQNTAISIQVILLKTVCNIPINVKEFALMNAGSMMLDEDLPIPAPQAELEFSYDYQWTGK